jgi:hypothetical protein
LPGGGPQGPYIDRNPRECGHGEVIPLKTDVEVRVEAPSVATVGAEIFVKVTVTNRGPLPIDGDSTFAFSDLKDITGITGGDVFVSLPVGGKSERIFKFKADKEGLYNVKVSASPLVAGCGFTSEIVSDPNPDNNSVETSIAVTNAAVGSKPDFLPQFALPFSSITPGSTTFDLKLINTGLSAPGLVAAQGDEVAVYQNDGTGGFVKFFDFTSPAEESVKAIEVADVNNDNKQDVVTLSSKGKVSTFLAATAGLASNPVISGRLDGGNLSDVLMVAADFNRDGSVDLSVCLRVQGTPPLALEEFAGDGSGSFSAPPPNAPRSITICDTCADFDMAAGDTNGDGIPDICVAVDSSTPDSSGRVLTFLGDGTGSFNQGASLTVGAHPSSILLNDINRDGNLDIVTTNSRSNTISVALGDGRGSFPSITNIPVGNNPVDIVAGDFNGNGKTDLAVVNQGSNNVTIILGDGNGLFVPVLNIPTGQNPASVTASDFNRDGKPDLAVANKGAAGAPNLAQAESDSDDIHPALANPNLPGITILLYGAAPVTRPTITGVEVSGKKLVVTGTGFDSGAKILVDGNEQSTTNDPGSPTTKLTSKKGGKKIKVGKTVVVQAESEGKFSEGFVYTRPQ